MPSLAQVLTLEIATRELPDYTAASSADEMIADWLKEAVTLFEQKAGRQIPERRHTERVGSRGGVRLIVSHAPIVEIHEITRGETTLDADTYEIDDAEAGLIARSSTGISGFASTEYTDGRSIQTIATADAPDKEWSIDYTGGWVTPYQIDNDSDLSDSDRTLPYDIQRALVDYIKMRWAHETKDPSIASESLMDWSVDYIEGRRVPASLTGAISSYQRPMIP